MAKAKTEGRLPYRVAELIDCDAEPVDIVVNGSLNHLYIIHQKDKTLCVLDTSTRSVLKRIPLGGQGTALALDAYTNRVYISDAARSLITVVDGVLLKVTKTVHVGGSPGALAVDTEAGKIYVADSEAGVVKVVDGKRLKFEREVRMDPGPTTIAVDRKAGRVVVANSNNRTLTMFAGPTGAGKRTVKCPDAPGEVLVDRKTGAVWVALPGAGKVMVLEREKSVFLGTGSRPSCLALDQGRDLLFVGDAKDQEIRIIDVSTKRILQRIPLTGSPLRLAFDPSDRSLYVALEGKHAVRRLALARPKPGEEPRRRRWARRSLGRIPEAALAVAGGVLKQTHGFARVSYEEDALGGRKTRTFEKEGRLNLTGILGNSRIGRYRGNVGMKRAMIERDGADYETLNDVYDMNLSLFPESRSPLALYARRDVNEISADVSTSRRLVTDTYGTRWATRPWRGAKLSLFGEQVKAEDDLDPASYKSNTLRHGGRLSQNFSQGTWWLDYESTELSGDQQFAGDLTQETSFQLDWNPARNLNIDAEYRYLNLDSSLMFDSETHFGRVRADYREGDLFTAVLDIQSDINTSERSEANRLGASSVLRYYPVRSETSTWQLGLSSRLDRNEGTVFSPTPSSFASKSAAVALSSEHRVRSRRWELTGTYGATYEQTLASTELSREKTLDEIGESAGGRVLFRPKPWWELWSGAQFRLWQRKLDGLSDNIGEIELDSGTILNIHRRFQARGEIQTSFSDEAGRPRSETITLIETEWAAHDHAWQWGSDSLRLGSRLDRRDDSWTEQWYIRYRFAARFTERSLATLDLNQEWQGNRVDSRRIFEGRLGLRYDLNQLTARISYVYANSRGGPEPDRNYFFVMVQRTF